MRIAIFSDHFYPELSGIADSIFSLAKELASRGHLVRFYVPHYSARDFAKVHLPCKEIDLGERVTVKRFFSFPNVLGVSARLVIPTGTRIMDVRRWQPDIIHTQLFGGVGLEALLAAWVLKIPLVGTNHTATSEFARYAPFAKNWVERVSVNYVDWYYNHCAVVTGPSRAILDEMIASGLTRPATPISNPIDVSLFAPVSAPRKLELKKKFGFSGNTVIYAGRLALEKNINVLIKAIAVAKEKVPDIQLALAGHGPDEASLKQLATKLNVEKRVLFLGLLDKATLANAFQACELFAIASTGETQCMGMIQAMACGVPTVGVNARALPEYLAYHNGVVVEPGDFHAFARNFAAFAAQPAAREQMGHHALRFAHTVSPEKIAEKWETIYARAIKEHQLKK